MGYIYIYSLFRGVTLKESSARPPEPYSYLQAIYQAFFLLLFLSVAVAACDGVDWESRDLRFQLALARAEEAGGSSMYIAPFSIASMRDQQSAATRELKRTSTWALRMSRRRMNIARDCSAAL